MNMRKVRFVWGVLVWWFGAAGGSRERGAQTATQDEGLSLPAAPVGGRAPAT